MEIIIKGSVEIYLVLISAILTLKQSLNCLERLKIFDSECIDLAQVMLGYQSVESGNDDFNSSLSCEYETGLVSRLAELTAASSYDQM